MLIVSGFLGAGKTSFIKALLNNNAEQFTILENDYANIGTDADDLSKIALDNIDIQEMSDGCICCSKKGDFASSILTISNTLDPNYLIIEPSGVAMLSNILANIKKSRI